jgi:hypothetical protein
MSKMYIRVIKDGFIYDYSEILAVNPGCEVISEEIAYPERFVTEEVVEKVKKARAKRGFGLDLSTEDVPQEPEYTNADVNADASRKLP